MDGYVFGAMDPPLITMPGTVSGDVILIDNKGVGMFGDIKGRVDAAQQTFSATLTNIPGGSIQYVTTLGTIDGRVVDLDYTVKFPGTPTPYNPAYGVMFATKPQALVISRVQRDGQNLLLEWVGGQGPFQLQTCTDISAPGWQNVGALTSGRSASVAIGPGPQTFYRVVGH
jgi:hypothetical protein